MAYTNVAVSDSGGSYSGYNHDTIKKEISRNRVIGGDEHAFNTIELGEKIKNVISNASGSNGNTSFKLEALRDFLNKAKEAIEDIRSDIDQISFYAEGMADLLNGDGSGLCEAWKTLKETADGLLEAFNSRAENFITVIENYYKESEQNSEEWKNKVSKINEGFGEIQGFLKNRNS